MRFSVIAVVAGFSSTALAQGLLNQIPKCAQTCFGGNLGTCGIADIACICGSKTIDAVSCCVFATCSQADIAATTQFGVQLCKLQNVNINTQPSCPSGSATPSGSTIPASSSAPSAGNSTATTVSGSVSTTASGSASHTSGSASHTSASAAGSTGAAPYQSAGAGVGFGIAMAGLLAAL